MFWNTSPNSLSHFFHDVLLLSTRFCLNLRFRSWICVTLHYLHIRLQLKDVYFYFELSTREILLKTWIFTTAVFVEKLPKSHTFTEFSSWSNDVKVMLKYSTMKSSNYLFRVLCVQLSNDHLTACFESIPKRNRLILHSPFCLFIRKNTPTK